MTEKTINFKILSNKNENVYLEGYININDEDAENVDWYYWTGSQYQSSPFYHHNEEEISGLTDKQNDEIDEFINDYMNDLLWIDTCILQSNENENRNHIRENCTLIINEGAKMECEIVESPERGDYMVEVIPYFNGKKIDIAYYMVDMNEEFDPWDNDLGDSVVEHGHIYFEMSKDYWDEEFREELMEDVNEEARRIYARALTYELGIYAKYGDVMEQALDGSYENDWLFKISQFVNKSDEELDAFLREEGLIDEE